MSNNNIPIVQGYALNNNLHNNAHKAHDNSSNHPYAQEPLVTEPVQFNGQKGESQPRRFNDVFFAVLFYLHLGIMFVILLPLSISLNDGNGGGGDGGGGDIGQIIYFVSVCGVFATGLATVSLGFMMSFATQLIKLALFFHIGTSLLLSILGFMAGSLLMGILCFVSFAFSICYTCMVWHRIPFASANLNTALSAVRANLGISIVAYTFLFLGFAFSILWTTITNNILNAYPSMSFLLFLSYYWTHQVLSNTMHVTTAGVIGTWWFQPTEANSFCSKSIGDSFHRATTYSFGSICFGSLIVATIQALRQLNHQLRGNEDAQLLVCLIDCCLACIEGIVEYFNKWAYIYVGLYGYSYLDAGKNVITLFQNKGWTVIITDDLAENVLFMISLLIGLITGLMGYLLSYFDQNIFANFNANIDSASIGFGFGFLIGFVLSSILLSVVASAVNTVIVCFAESPREFEMNHPQLSLEMRNAWRMAWPQECGMI